jgi:hypothetical protein
MCEGDLAGSHVRASMYVYYTYTRKPYTQTVSAYACACACVCVCCMHACRQVPRYVHGWGYKLYLNPRTTPQWSITIKMQPYHPMAQLVLTRIPIRPLPHFLLSDQDPQEVLCYILMHMSAVSTLLPTRSSRRPLHAFRRPIEGGFCI